MKVNEIKPNILILEYRQEKGDKDYGSCLWARFMFNLDRYELSIMSDCGNYGYKWVETPNSESFLQLMSRCDDGYIINKLYGSPDIFSFEETKKEAYKSMVIVDEDKQKLDEIFQEFEDTWEPETSESFCTRFEEYNDGYFDGGYVWSLPEYEYPANVLKIVSVFENCIKPKIKEIISNQ